MKNKHYENVFRAIEKYSPNNLFLNIEKGETNLIPTNKFMIIEMGNGKARLLPHIPMINIYRGQTVDYAIQPSILRANPTPTEIMINNIKNIDYKLILMEHPMVEMAIKETLDIDFESLAQHYGLQTNAIDFTFDIGIAAFFATNYYDHGDETYRPMKDGTGVIYKDMSIANSIDDYIALGVQPFKRPHKQQAVSIKKDNWDKYNKNITKITFKHNYEMGNKINRFFTGTNNLFPKESITEITNEIIKLDKVSKKAISIYSHQRSLKEKRICELIENYGYKIVDDLIYQIPKDLKDDIRKKLKPSIIEELGVQVFSGLSF